MPYAILLTLAGVWTLVLGYGQFTPNWGELVDPTVTGIGAMGHFVVMTAAIGAYCIYHRWMRHYRVPLALLTFGVVSLIWGALWSFGPLNSFYVLGGPATNTQAVGHIGLWLGFIALGMIAIIGAIRIFFDIGKGQAWTFRRFGELFAPAYNPTVDESGPPVA